mgnify:CR=1 FL=1
MKNKSVAFHYDDARVGRRAVRGGDRDARRCRRNRQTRVISGDHGVVREGLREVYRLVCRSVVLVNRESYRFRR